MIWRIAFSTLALAVLSVFFFAHKIAQGEFLGFPHAGTWSELGGVFTGIAAIFSAIAAIGVLITLFLHTKDSARQAERHAQDNAEQAQRFQKSLKTNSDAIDRLKEAAGALTSQVTEMAANAQAAREQAETASKHLIFIMGRPRLDRIDRLMERFYAAEPPDPLKLDKLDITADTDQGSVRMLLPEIWCISLHVLIDEILSLKDDEKVVPELKEEASIYLKELQKRITSGEKTALALAELTPVKLMARDYEPSKFAKSLKAAALFPFINLETSRYKAWRKA
ncbi:MAG: hypothetical protein QM682_03185 [Paracoccus sp. (in: a-proteobacteria)]|uniref:hypothetical protein n=1 Tax=Paracoccus sp. TaxID=267 RepID=UPI0039E5A938